MGNCSTPKTDQRRIFFNNSEKGDEKKVEIVFVLTTNQSQFKNYKKCLVDNADMIWFNQMSGKCWLATEKSF